MTAADVPSRETSSKTPTDGENPLEGVVARALRDVAFRERLVADPRAVLAAEGFALPEGVAVTVVEDTATIWHLVLPAGAQELTEAELAEVVAGGCLPGLFFPLPWDTATALGPPLSFSPPVTPRPSPTALPG